MNWKSLLVFSSKGATISNTVNIYHSNPAKKSLYKEKKWKMIADKKSTILEKKVSNNYYT